MFSATHFRTRLPVQHRPEDRPTPRRRVDTGIAVCLRLTVPRIQHQRSKCLKWGKAILNPRPAARNCHASSPHCVDVNVALHVYRYVMTLTIAVNKDRMHILDSKGILFRLLQLQGPWDRRAGVLRFSQNLVNTPQKTSSRSGS